MVRILTNAAEGGMILAQRYPHGTFDAVLGHDLVQWDPSSAGRRTKRRRSGYPLPAIRNDEQTISPNDITSNPIQQNAPQINANMTLDPSFGNLSEEQKELLHICKAVFLLLTSHLLIKTQLFIGYSELGPS